MKNMKRLNSLLPLSLALALADCVNLAPKYERPAAPVAGAFPNVEGTVSSGNAVANQAPASIGWQHFFTDARLQQLITLALNNNRDLRVAALNIEQARGKCGIQRSNQFRRITGVAQATRQSTSGDQPFEKNYQ